MLLAFLERMTLALYARAAAHAESRGIILADTKFEFGWTGEPGASDLILIDEALTPDSSRFWPKDAYRPGGPQPSYDKQFVRDYLEAIRWNKQPPVPALPDDVVQRTREKYLEAFHLLTGPGPASERPRPLRPARSARGRDGRGRHHPRRGPRRPSSRASSSARSTAPTGISDTPPSNSASTATPSPAR